MSIKLKGINQFQTKDLDEALANINANFNVGSRIMSYYKDNNSKIIVPNYLANVREDNNSFLGIVSNDYKIIQNKECFSFTEDILKEDNFSYTGGLVTNNGARLFITIKLPKKIKLDNNEEVDLYCRISTSHDGSSSIKFNFFALRLVCSNGLVVKEDKGLVNIRHCSNAKDKLKLVKHFIETTERFSRNILEDFNKMINTSTEGTGRHAIDRYWTNCLTGKQYDNKTSHFTSNFELVDSNGHSLPKEQQLSTVTINQLKEIEKYYYDDDTQKDIHNTVWGAYNAITGYVDNIAFNDKVVKNVEKALNYKFNGIGNTIKERAYTNALELIKV